MLRSYCHGTVFGDRQVAEPARDGQVAGGADPAETPAVVALHGWGRNRDDLGRVVAGHDVLSLDLPGFGASPPPPEAWGSADYATCVSQALDEVGADTRPVVVLGHSFGGRVAVWLAADHPQQVAGLVLTGVPLLRSAGPGPKPPLGYRLVKVAHRAHLVSDDRLERARRQHGSEDYRNATGVMRDVLVRSVNEDYAEPLGRVQAPVELVWGEGDTAAPVAMARRAEQLLVEAGTPVRLTVEAGGTHDSPLRQPEALRAALDRLLPAPTR
jgi:pimeloyl-ACP methyl ester carboxylesterase